MNPYKIIVTDNRFTSYALEEKIFTQAGASLKVYSFTSDNEFTDEVLNADALLVNLCPVGSETIKNLTRCKVISRYGAGYDNVDVDAATRQGIWVTNVPDYCTEEASDHAIALLLNCIRKISFVDSRVREGKWNIHQDLSISRIKGKILGLIGYGRIARAVHKKMKGFNLEEVLVYDPYVDTQIITKNGALSVSKDQLLKTADFISLHVPLTKETKKFIGPSELSIIKKDGILINTSRGAVIDEKALEQTLFQRKIRCAGLDVFEKEPQKADSPFFTLDNIVLTSHMAYYSNEALRELKIKTAENAVAILKGEKSLYSVNSILK